MVSGDSIYLSPEMSKNIGESDDKCSCYKIELLPKMCLGGDIKIERQYKEQIELYIKLYEEYNVNHANIQYI